VGRLQRSDEGDETFMPVFHDSNSIDTVKSPKQVVSSNLLAAKIVVHTLLIEFNVLIPTSTKTPSSRAFSINS
jgi:hypothetical protein